GAIVAGIFYQSIGVFASLLVSAVLLGFGAAKLFYPRLRMAPRIPWIVLFIVSGACLDQFWDVSHLLGLKVPVDIQGSGGMIGYRFSDQRRGLLPAALGPVGSFILLMGIYLTTLILVTGLRPIHLIREMVLATRRTVRRMREWRLRRRIRRSDLKEKLKTEKSGERWKRYRSSSGKEGCLCRNRPGHSFRRRNWLRDQNRKSSIRPCRRANTSPCGNRLLPNCAPARKRRSLRPARQRLLRAGKIMCCQALICSKSTVSRGARPPIPLSCERSNKF